MTKDELLQAVRDGRVQSQELGDEEDWAKDQPQNYLLTALMNSDVTFDGEPIEFIEQSGPKREYYDEDLDGRPMKFVWKIDGTVFVAIGSYDSWEGEHFPKGFFEAELVNVPTWLPKS